MTPPATDTEVGGSKGTSGNGFSLVLLALGAFALAGSLLRAAGKPNRR